MFMCFVTHTQTSQNYTVHPQIGTTRYIIESTQAFICSEVDPRYLLSSLGDDAERVSHDMHKLDTNPKHMHLFAFV